MTSVGRGNPSTNSAKQANVQAFLRSFAAARREGSVADASDLYHKSLPDLTLQPLRGEGKATAEEQRRSEAHRGGRPGTRMNPRSSFTPIVSLLPSFYTVQHYLASDPVNIVLYKELYYRLLYQQKEISMNARVEAWMNYREYIQLVKKKKLSFPLPLKWIWDILEEFVYQTQSFCHFRLREGESLGLRLNQPSPEVGNVIETIQSFEDLATESNVRVSLQNLKEVETQGADENVCNIAPHEGDPSRVLWWSGVYALFLLVRLRVQLGDYHTALQTLEGTPLLRRIDATDSLLQIPNARLTFYYHTGFSCLMLRRYADAHFLLSRAVRWGKIYQYLSDPLQSLAALRRQSIAALSIVLMLYSMKPDETLQDVIRESTEELAAMTYDETAFKAVFMKACPKYITPLHAEENEDSVYHYSPFVLMENHCMILFREVQQQSWLPELRSYLTMYDKINLEDLHNLHTTGEGSRSEKISHLITWKHKLYQLSAIPQAQADQGFSFAKARLETSNQEQSLSPPKVSNLPYFGESKDGVSSLSGEYHLLTPHGVDFYLDKDTIHVKRITPIEDPCQVDLHVIQHLMKEIKTVDSIFRSVCEK